MAEVKKRKRKTIEKQPKFEEQEGLNKLSIYVSIVNSGLANNVVKIMESVGCSASFIQNGEGTATEALKDVLNIVDTKKDVVISIIKNKDLEQVQTEMNAFFLAAKRNRGIGFAIQMNSIVGVRIYKFLSQTL
jgi:hypothetical protein